MVPIYTIPARIRGELGKLEFGGPFEWRGPVSESEILSIAP